MSTTIFWDAKSDIRRKNFSITVEAVDRNCQLGFPGFTFDGIPPSYRSFRIPLELNDAEHTALEIEHDCKYQVILVSNPYSSNNVAAYTATFNFTVPHCIQGRCSCKDNTPEAVQNVDVLVIRDKNVIVPRISWNHPDAENSVFVYEVEIVYSRKNRFKNDDNEMLDSEGQVTASNTDEYFAEGDMIEKTEFMEQKINSKKGQTHYSLLWPSSLTPDEEYVVFVYAKNKHLCISFPAKRLFSTSKEHLVNIKDISEDIADLTSETLSKAPFNISHSNHSITDNSAVSKANFTVTSATGTLINAYPLWIFILIWILLSIGFLIVCFLCYFLLRKYCIQSGKSEIEKSSIIPWAMAHSSHSMLETNILYHRSFGTNFADVICEIPSSQIQVGAIIGQGAFGMVCMGTIHGVEGFGRSTTVAIKQLNVNAEDFQKSEFTAEIDIMKQVGKHPNIVAMYGFCNEPNHQCMIMEYVPFGDLKHYLQELRKQFDIVVYNKKCGKNFDMSSNSPSTSMNSAMITNNGKYAESSSYCLDPNELQNFALQVASGMAHIESLGIIHRDLAARNILVGRGKQLKISDFGLSRRGVYVKTSKGIIPLRWLSIEAIEHNLYSTKSDVWAYGVVLWEICTLAGFPYASVSDKELLKHLQQGNRLQKPSSCANEIYDIMMKCWAEEPTERPSFASLCEYLSDLNNQDCPYVEFLLDDELPPLDIPSEFDGFEASAIDNVHQRQKRELITAVS
uniref:Protein kinase domain-containing protein n=1 Tax=Syphacia muris TaxID=451379 RepID=A0A158R5H6_9BILA